MNTAACILGCSGLRLTAGEREFFQKAQPWGFILFQRNLESPNQVRALTAELRACVNRHDAPILVDQEGGRVQRLGPPHWRRYPPARLYGELAARDPATAREIARLGARLIAHDLASLGINVDCMPVLDVPAPDANAIIGDRAYGESAALAGLLGRAAAEGLIAGGVLPVIKHIPGHGRARADSHLALPVVEATAEELDQRDFVPFRMLSDMPMAMTAHVVYPAFDPRRAATITPKVIGRVVRGLIGFDGLVMTDDLSMRALSGTLTRRAKTSLAAGCDVVLHCNGDMGEMAQVLAGTRPLAAHAKARAAAALARLPRTPEPFDAEEGRARFDAALDGLWAP
jgi:beta-N-acetylhexosaminidase